MYILQIFISNTIISANTTFLFKIFIIIIIIVNVTFLQHSYNKVKKHLTIQKQKSAYLLNVIFDLAHYMTIYSVNHIN